MPDKRQMVTVLGSLGITNQPYLGVLTAFFNAVEGRSDYLIELVEFRGNSLGIRFVDIPAPLSTIRWQICPDKIYFIEEDCSRVFRGDSPGWIDEAAAYLVAKYKGQA